MSAQAVAILVAKLMILVFSLMFPGLFWGGCCVYDVLLFEVGGVGGGVL